MNTLGLTLGKFAPLHKGHQFMIETALQEVDELILVIYETTVTRSRFMSGQIGFAGSIRKSG